MNLNSFIKSFTIIALGNLILAFGMYNIHFQNEVTEGGVLGLSLLLSHWTSISAGIYAIIVDVVAYYISIKHFGKLFLVKALFSSVSYGLFYMLFENIGFIIPNLQNYQFISAILGGGFVGIGVGIIVRNGGACGGDDAIVLMVNKLTKIKIQYVYLFSDLSILLLSLSYIPLLNVIYCIITVTISSSIIGLLHAK